MLYIHVGNVKYLDTVLPNLILDVDSYFNINFEPHWIDNDLAKQMILDVDKSEVQAPYCIMSPIFGQIPPEKISGGVKALLLMLQSDDDVVVWATACGDNCAKWILEISKQKDLHIGLSHLMSFSNISGNFEAVVVETGRKYMNGSDLTFGIADVIYSPTNEDGVDIER